MLIIFMHLHNHLLLSKADPFQDPQWMPKTGIVPNPIYTMIFSYTFIFFHLKEALYSFSLAYPNCQYHDSYALGPLK